MRRSTRRPPVHDYASAAAYLGRKGSRPLPGRSTRLVYVSADEIAVRYHWSNVVRYFADGAIQLFANGYYTVTTKARLNAYTPASVWSNRGEWTLAIDGQRMPFFDGITLMPPVVPAIGAQLDMFALPSAWRVG